MTVGDERSGGWAGLGSGPVAVSLERLLCSVPLVPDSLHPGGEDCASVPRPSILEEGAPDEYSYVCELRDPDAVGSR